MAGMELTLQILSLSLSLLNIASSALKSIFSLRERVCLICVSLCLDVYVSRGGPAFALQDVCMVHRLSFLSINHGHFCSFNKGMFL